MLKLKPTKQKYTSKRIFGFDIETYDRNKQFYMASIVGENYVKTFYTKQDFLQEIKTNPIFKNSILFATNLSFDFFGIFFTEEDKKYVHTVFRGSDLLYAKTFLKTQQFAHQQNTRKHKTLPSITFLDTMNYAKISVKKMGEIVGSPKYETPSFIGKLPKNETEKHIMERYNIQDSTTTYMFAKFLVKSFEDLGATFGNTLASTSKNLFTNRFLDKEYRIAPEEILLEQFNAYYGGRTETFERGYITDYNYYDFNSLYPSIMAQKTFPDPNTLRVTHKNTKKYIEQYEGVSHVRIYVPQMDYPPLPHRQENGRVIFPCGTLDGWFSHIEIRHAMKLGCVLQKVYKTQYTKTTCKPFAGFVTTLYNLRKEFKQTNNPMEFVVKIMMNSLYGKFGQKWRDLDNWQHESTVTLKDIAKAGIVERMGKYMRLGKIQAKPKNFSIPLWAIYTTAYGRIKLHEAIVKHKPVYVDTDSLITKDTIPESNELGELKREMKIASGIIVRPKFYTLRPYGTDELAEDENNVYKGYVKIKGLARKLTYAEFFAFMVHPEISYTKFTKFKEAMRRGLTPNEIIPITKKLSLEDEKREWDTPFRYREHQTSKAKWITI